MATPWGEWLGQNNICHTGLWITCRYGAGEIHASREVVQESMAAISFAWWMLLLKDVTCAMHSTTSLKWLVWCWQAGANIGEKLRAIIWVMYSIPHDHFPIGEEACTQVRLGKLFNLWTSEWLLYYENSIMVPYAQCKWSCLALPFPTNISFGTNHDGKSTYGSLQKISPRLQKESEQFGGMYCALNPNGENITCLVIIGIQLFSLLRTTWNGVYYTIQQSSHQQKLTPIKLSHREYSLHP